MDNQVNDFLNEINEIAPPSSSAVQDKVWKECFDELTGYAYYWNKQTDEVTWDPPQSFKQNKTSQKTPPKGPPQKKNLFDPRDQDLFSGINKSKLVPTDSIKIYSVGGTSKAVITQPKIVKKQPIKRHRRDSEESEDEKITLISSYGTDTDSEEEPPDTKKAKQEKTSSVESDKYNSDEDEDLDLLTKIQKKAQELKALGGVIPVEVKKVVETSKKELLNSTNTNDVIAGQSLVAGYYSDSEEENEEIKNVTGPIPELPQVAHSTLFPVTQPINVNDFTPPKPEVNNTNVNKEDNFDTKLFMRKKKITIPEMTVAKRDDDGENRKGFGFNKESTISEKIGENLYPGFIKGGVAFVKSDVLNPTNNNEEPISTAKTITIEDQSVNKEEIDNMYGILKDKLTFLNEGRPPISSVQAMVIQAETLVVAMDDGALKGSYLTKWLGDTCSELKKLEKEATPTGWVMQWDRVHRRYFYQHRSTGTSQWEYPQPDINTCDVAMDISTTPPPPNDIEPNPEEMSPPLPPTIRSPTPPPPPVISGLELEEVVTVIDVPLPNDVSQNGNLQQPLPPGVDISEPTSVPQSKDSLNSALDSFYSDIAAITSSPPPAVEDPSPENVTAAAEIHMETVKRKKKTKVKLAPGLSMKKKGVNQLVEKWKSVQQEYKN